MDFIKRGFDSNLAPSLPQGSPSAQNGRKLSLHVELKDRYNTYCEYERSVFSAFASRIELPVAKVGEPFKVEFDPFDSRRAGAPKVTLKMLEQSGFEELGLRCSIERDCILTISGVPSAAFDGRVCFDWSDGSSNNVNRTQFPWSVVESDPFSLWEKHDPPKDAPFNKISDVCYGTSLAYGRGSSNAPLTVLAARKRGRSHEHVASFCDDDYAIKLADDRLGWSVFAVADGAGSAKYSREGSRIACETLTQDLSAYLNSPDCPQISLLRAFLGRLSEVSAYPGFLKFSKDDVKLLQFDRVLTQALRKAWDKIKATADAYHAEIRDFHTTALVVAIKRFDDDLRNAGHLTVRPTWIVLSYWVGDGGLAIYRPNGMDLPLLLGAPDGGEYAGETRFMTMPKEVDVERVLERTHLTAVSDFKSIVLMTDGMTDPLFPSDVKLKDAACWNTFWDETLPKEAPGVFDVSLTPDERAQRLLKGLEFKVRGCHDDRTIVTIVNDFLGKSLSYEK